MLANELRNFNITTKIPYYPQGQAIVEWHHQILNWQTNKQTKKTNGALCGHLNSHMLFTYCNFIFFHFKGLPNTLNDPYIVCIARGSPMPPQPGQEVAKSPNDIYTISVTKTWQEPSLGSLSLSLEPIFWKKWQVSWVELQCTYSSLCTGECITSGHLFFFLPHCSVF